MNKLLKVLEDRRVFLERLLQLGINTGPHSRDLSKGLPADFRLVGATTRMPSSAPALRSRCLEFWQLHPDRLPSSPRAPRKVELQSKTKPWMS